MNDYTLHVSYTDLESATLRESRQAMGGLARLAKTRGLQLLKHNSPVLTGEMQSSVASTRVQRIGYRGSGFRFYLTVGNEWTTNSHGDQYPPFVEFGTYKMEPRGFALQTSEELSKYIEEIRGVYVKGLYERLKSAPTVWVESTFFW